MHTNLFRISVLSLVVVVVVLFSGFDGAEGSHLKRVKCLIGRYYNDGCTECNCDPDTGITICDKSRCPDHRRTCPHGEVFKDRSGNQCKCYEDTGAVFCSILTFRKKGIVPHAIEFSRRAGAGLGEGEDDTLIGVEEIEDSSSQMDQIAVESSMPKLSLLPDKENFSRAFYSSSEEDESKMPPMKMLEYSGRRWKMRPERIAFSDYKQQIDKVLETLRERRNAGEQETVYVELPHL